jgi:hypothetical protein
MIHLSCERTQVVYTTDFVVVLVDERIDVRDRTMTMEIQYRTCRFDRECNYLTFDK